jgi:pyruvate kinase
MRKAKIVCTIGPVTSSEKMLEALISNGMDVARLNFSHGDQVFHGSMVSRIRKLSDKLKRPVAILQDLQGIKIRVGRLEGGKTRLVKGEKVTILQGDGPGDSKRIFIDYPWLIEDAKVGDTILLDDGLIQMGVVEKQSESLVTTVVEGGVLKEKKGVNLPHMKISAVSFTEKDRKDLEFGIKIGVDYVALSFVRNVRDVKRVKSWLARRGTSVPLIAKIEKEEALDDIDGILSEVDGIMVARGDLGVEMPLEEVPMFQKMLIGKANRVGKLVITATQMLESMTVHQRPTRAETTDVANAVLDGTDALMLSAETSAGAYPIDALKVMERIIEYTESTRPSTITVSRRAERLLAEEVHGFPSAVAHAATEAARDVEAKWIVAFTKSGFTARLISKYRPSTPILAFSPDERVVKQMSIFWGVKPHLVGFLENTDRLINEVDSLLKTSGYAAKGDRIIIVASHPPSIAGKTNFMKMHEVTG